MEIGLLQTILDKHRKIKQPELIKGDTVTRIRIICSGNNTEQIEANPEREHILSSIKQLTTAGWNIIKITTSDHPQSEILVVIIKMAKYPTPLRLTEMASDRVTRTVYQFNHYDDYTDYTLNSVTLGEAIQKPKEFRQGYTENRQTTSNEENSLAAPHNQMEDTPNIETERIIDIYGLGDYNEFSLPPDIFPDLSIKDLKELSLKAADFEETLFENK